MRYLNDLFIGRFSFKMRWDRESRAQSQTGTGRTPYLHEYNDDEDHIGLTALTRFIISEATIAATTMMMVITIVKMVLAVMIVVTRPQASY